MSRRQLERGVPQRGMVGPAGVVPLNPAELGGGDHCHVLHVDMDAFFAEVEQLDRPDTRGRPVVVGGAGPRGVVSSANYEARGHGVHSAMPMVRALRLCPEAVVIPADPAKYSRVSRAVFDILDSLTPVVERLSLDEAFLDVSGAQRRLGDPVRIAELIRTRIREEQGLTCSVGAASTKFVAKLASTVCKPDGLLVVPPEHAVAFMHPRPVGDLWGVGEKTEAVLNRLGLRTVGDVATRVSVEVLCDQLGEAAGRSLAALARGEDPRPVTPRPEAAERSVGAEETFAADTTDTALLRRTLLKLSQRVGRRLRRDGLAGRTVVVKLRRADFSTLTRSRTLAEPTDLARDIHTAAWGLYLGAGVERRPLRLVGVRVEGLIEARHGHHQLALGEDEDAWSAAERVADRVVRRFGSGAIGPAALSEEGDDD